jgi:hypothetical protein
MDQGIAANGEAKPIFTTETRRKSGIASILAIPAILAMLAIF